MTRERYPTARIQKDIRMAVEGSHEPLGIAELMFSIDVRERIAATADELNEALSALISAGLVHEVPERRFAAGLSNEAASSFSPLTDEEVRIAYVEYAAKFNSLDEIELPPHTPMNPKVDCIYALPNGHYPDEADEDKLEPIVDSLLAELESSGIVGAVFGLQFGPGAIDFVINAAGSVDAEEVLRIVRPIFLRVAPPGSNCAIGLWGDAAPRQS